MPARIGGVTHGREGGGEAGAPVARMHSPMDEAASDQSTGKVGSRAPQFIRGVGVPRLIAATEWPLVAPSQLTVMSTW